MSSRKSWTSATRRCFMRAAPYPAARLGTRRARPAALRPRRPRRRVPRARHSMTILPVILRSPAWARENPSLYTSPPRRDADYTNLLGTLIDRYGPHGSFWGEHPDVPRRPQRDWQIWNEPNIDRYWGSPVPFPHRYAQLLRASYRAIKKADPGARVVLTGFANFSWRALAQAYRAGIKGYFDLAAVHPF